MKKIACDDNCSTFKHESGHEIKIAHKSLPHNLRKQIELLPLCEGGSYEDGGEVKSEKQRRKDEKTSRETTKPSPETSKHGESHKEESLRESQREAKPSTEDAQKLAQGGKTVVNVRPDTGYGRVVHTYKEQEKQPEPQSSQGTFEKHEKRQKKMADGGIMDSLVNGPSDEWQPPQQTPEPAPRREQTPDETREQAHKASQAADSIRSRNSWGFAEGTPDGGVPPEDTAPQAPQQAPPQNQLPNFDTSQEQTPPAPQVNVPQVDQSAPNTINSNGTVNVPESVRLGQRAADTNAQVASELGRLKGIKDTAEAQEQARFAKSIQDRYNAFNGVTQDFGKELQAGMVQPDHYRSSMSEPQKVSTAIGLFLGGIGMGLGQRSNPAMDFLNRQIDRDIDAQKSRQQDRSTIYGAMKNLYGEGNVADLATKNAHLEILKNQFEAAADKLATPQARAQAQQAISQLGLQQANNARDAAQDMAIETSYSRQAPGGQRPQGGAPKDEGQQPKQQGDTSASNDPDHILGPDAQNKMQSLVASGFPAHKVEAGEIQTQFQNAALTDKAIDAIKEHFPQMYANIKQEYQPNSEKDRTATGDALAKVMTKASDLSGYLHRKAESYHNTPYIGKAIEATGKGLTDTQRNRDYDVHHDAMVSAVTAALAKAGVAPTEASEMAQTMAPELGDTKKMAALKMKTAIEKLKNATKTDALDRVKVTQKAKKP